MVETRTFSSGQSVDVQAGTVRGAAVSALRVEPSLAQKHATDLIDTLVDLGNRVRAGHSVQAIGVSMKGIIDPQRGMILDVNESLSDLIGICLLRSPVSSSS